MRIAQPELLRAKQQRGRRRLQLPADQWRALLQPVQRVCQSAVPDRSGTHHQSAVGNCISHRLKFFRRFQNLARADRRPRLPERNLIWIDHPQPRESKIEHGPRRRSDIQWIARRDQNHAKVGGG
jgi:hypothetical protein